MAKRLFGTDGIRGIAGEFPLDARTAYAFGCALGSWAADRAPSGAPAEVLIGMDTRESGPALARLVAGGLVNRGVRVRFAGLITTPGIAYLARTDSFTAGVMISASHNPYRDNGLKAFDHSGFKLPDDQESLIEEEIFRLLDTKIEPREAPLEADEGLGRAYAEYLRSTFQASLVGVSLVVDCANGAASYLGPDLFRRLGAEVRALGCDPDGRNINLNCGSLHLDGLRESVLQNKAHAGVAFDGDADRAIFVSASGKVVNGDAVLFLAAQALKGRNALKGDLVVATVMSNIGLERGLARRGVRLLRTPVGDKYVLEEMVRSGASLGGEQSGHVIFRDFATTGDGLLTALRVFEIMTSSGLGLDELTQDLEIYPQILVNVRVQTKRPLSELETVGQEIRDAEGAFGEAGRVLVRFSGTEPLARVMVEGPDEALVRHYAYRIASAIETELGSASR
ncbi:MAG: phosphoglucosamine mutase [Bryobacteraceae bacterium]|jgi:phosphoglucosamine mutase|nr:phosphoglucosamine mutase [Bryobacteraceae bacterium]